MTKNKWFIWAYWPSNKNHGTVRVVIKKAWRPKKHWGRELVELVHSQPRGIPEQPFPTLYLAKHPVGKLPSNLFDLPLTDMIDTYGTNVVWIHFEAEDKVIYTMLTGSPSPGVPYEERRKQCAQQRAYGLDYTVG